jgi:beta-glucosidase
VVTAGPGSKKESLLKGIRQALGSQVEIRYAPTPERIVPDFGVVPACALASKSNGQEVRELSGEYFDNPRLEFRWTLNSHGRGIPFDWYSVRWTGW